jgi:hypothetical protein
MTTSTRVTFERVAPGEFAVFFDGQKTDLTIVNGSLGMSGSGRNMYGIVRVGAPVKWLGKLTTCKKTVALWLTAPTQK